MWDYVVQWNTQVMQQISTQSCGLRGSYTPQDVTGDIVDISEYLVFVFYYHVSYKDNSGLGVTSLGRLFVFYHRVGGIMLH